MSKKSLLPLQAIRELSLLPIDELIRKSAETSGSMRLKFALSACVKACRDGLGLEPFDEQISAAYSLYRGKIVQMATGEGKTVSAVFAAYLLRLDGHNIQIMTFNDYLAKRDYDWMKPVYDLLGTSVAYIITDTCHSERKKAYQSDVVYTTVRESGFDYLKNFVQYDKDEILGLKPDAVIVDEADSIMIDEGRIPLVIAGSIENNDKEMLTEISKFVKTLNKNDYSIYEENKNVYLTDAGQLKVDEHFKSGKPYYTENHDFTSLLFHCLKAEFYLEENTHYIVRDNRIMIVDEFTGRITGNRHYPGVLHSAVEAKHGLDISPRGTVMASIPLQYYIRQFGFIAGMTGTAASSAEEFELLYGLMLDVIPAHLPSARIDHPPEIYYNNDFKENAIVNNILSANSKGQPVLVGTSNIDESEKLVKKLNELNLKTQILNAKNDNMEAEIIKDAGNYGCITISTNMAGRGVDILLGGVDGKNRDAVLKAGGLLVISTAMYESSRINNQLKGRAGRQGDIGESKVFISLEDDIVVKYQLNKLIPKSRYPVYTENRITDKVVVREIKRIQRISEGDMLDMRKDLLKYTAITEKHRIAVFETRRKVLNDEIIPDFWQKYDYDNYEKATALFGEEKTAELQKNTLLYVINETWSVYLEFTDELRSGIHLTGIGGKNPIDEFNISSEMYYEKMDEQVIELMLLQLEKLLECKKTDKYLLPKHINIMTYLVEERVENLVKKPLLANVLSNLENEEAAPPGKSKKSLFSRFFN